MTYDRLICNAELVGHNEIFVKKFSGRQ